MNTPESALDAIEQEAEDIRDTTPAPFWTVAIYHVELMYGGPEEGDWWYTAGERVDHALEGVEADALLTVLTGSDPEHLAHGRAKQVQAILDVTVNRGRRELSSVLSDGRYQTRAYPGHPPQHFPATRPHYE